jgi:hypothetical protein
MKKFMAGKYQIFKQGENKVEIILSQEDIDKIIKDVYKGVTDIKYSTKKLKITLSVNSDILNRNIKPEVKKVEEKKSEPQEEILPIEARMNIMRSGNESDRTILKIG